MQRLKPIAALGAMLMALTLIGCSGDAGPTDSPSEGTTVTVSSPAADTPTPDVQMQSGEELTVEEYAEAMEEITARAAADDEIETAGEALFSGDLFSRDEVERIYSLEASESWTAEDVEFASDFAETTLQAVTGFYNVVLTALNGPFDEMSGLRPPEHLSDLHSDFIAAGRELLQLIRAQVDTVKNASTEIKDREELADFQAMVDSLESGPLDPALEQRAEELAARGEAACLALKEQLEAELGRDVNICGSGESDATSAETAVEPAPTAAIAVQPTGVSTREPMPAPDSTSAETDREALMALYNATDGPNWTNNDNWLSDRPLGQWYGVEIADGRVVGLALSENGLNGEIPSELGQLSRLEYLELDNNQLRGSIPPELGRLSYLFLLVLNTNSLSGVIPAELGHLSDLVWLDLYTNQLSGNIPPELGRLSYLEGLVLDDNRLSGGIPAELGQLSSLEHLALGINNLTGEIPAQLGQLSKLDYLDLADNDLTGEIPSVLGQLSRLTGLYVGGNELSGCVPSALRDVDENDLEELGLPSC